MATIVIDGEQLAVRLDGWQAVFALKREIVVPLSQVDSVSSGRVTALSPHGLRLTGTYLPKVIAAGSFWWKGRGWSFWSVRNPQQAVDIRLRDGHYRRLVIEVDDPFLTAAMIDSAVQASTANVQVSPETQAT